MIVSQSAIVSAQQQYRFDVIATSGASVSIFPGAAINNNGEVAFSGRTSGIGNIFTDYLSNQPRAVASIGVPVPSGNTQINDSRKILAQWSAFNTSPVQNYLAIVDGRATNSWTIAAAANGEGGFNDFNEIYPSGVAFNNNGRPLFQTRTGNNTTILTAGVRPQFATHLFTPSLGPIFRPIISNNNTSVFRKGNTTTSPIVTRSEDLGLLNEVIVAEASQGFTALGQSPSISKNDEAIAFYANLNQTGAVVLGTNPGPGIFVSIKLASGIRKIVRIAGRLVEDNSAPGGNDDGICDPGETCVPGELGTTTTGNRIFFSSFDQDSRVDVAYIPSGIAGIQDDLVMVSFIGTPNIASDVPGRIFSNQTGLWTQSVVISENNGAVRDTVTGSNRAISVAQVGDTINGNVLTGISVYDQIANNVNRVVFWASSAGGNMVIRAVRDPGRPVIFVAGVAGSELRHPKTGQRLWSPETTTSDLAPLSINNPVKAPDVLRKFTTGITPVGPNPEASVYESFLNYLKENGYTEYDLAGNENNRSATCGGQAEDPNQLAALRAKHPTLFVFPYDWRKSNGDTSAAGNVTRLREYIQCIRRIFPDTKVNIVAHSMGGLLSRRYILENPAPSGDPTANHHVKNFISIGSPWLGAPRAIHALETGSFISEAWVKTLSPPPNFGLADVLFASQIKQIIEGFPGAHELLPSQKYFELGGRPLRVDGVDYGYVQVRDWINSRHPNYNPGTNGETFHNRVGQDDFRNDQTGVNYYHIYGRQPWNRTVGRIEPRNWFLTGIIQGIVGQQLYSDFSAFPVAGDGTVPIISSSRRIDASDGLNATCGNSNDSRCIGVCYSESVDPEGELSQHNGMTSNPQIQSQILQILRFSEGFINQNPKFDPAETCHLPPNNFSPLTGPESHYIKMVGINNVLITDSQGNDNAAVSTAYKKLVPGVNELVTGPESMQIMTPVNNTYTMRFTGNGRLTAIEVIRGVTNELSDATYIVRYDDLVIPNGAVTELKIANNLVDSQKYDSDGNGIPDTVIPPSRVITNPQAADLQPPSATVNWGVRNFTRRVRVTATDAGSGVRRIYYRLPYATNFQFVNGNFANLKVVHRARGWTFDLVTEDNAGNRSGVVTYTIQ